MKVIIALLLVIVLAYAADKFSPGCTAECSAYYVCLAKGAWGGNNQNCVSPAGCECRKFYWQKSDEVAEEQPAKTEKPKRKFNFKNLLERIRGLAKPKRSEETAAQQSGEEKPKRRPRFSFLKRLLQKIAEKKREKKVEEPVPESDQFSPGCTAECSAYYVCLAKGAWGANNKNCVSPAGCECRKFYWQKNDEVAEVAEEPKKVEKTEKPKRKFNFKGLFQKLRERIANKLAAKSGEAQTEEKPKKQRGSFFRSLLNRLKEKIAKRRGEKKEDAQTEEKPKKRRGSFFGKLLERLAQRRQKKQKKDEEKKAEEPKPESDKFSPGCTAECSAYYVCLAKGAWGANNKNCVSPAGCECRKFYWQN